MPRGARLAQYTSAVQIIRYGTEHGTAEREGCGACNHLAAVESGKGCLRLALGANVKQGEETKAVGEQSF